jgi:predicted nucleic acid-binding protein
LDSLLSQGHAGSVGAHGLTEMYAVLTRTPFTPAIQPSEAWQTLEATILPHLEVIALSAPAYKQLVQHCATAGWIGGRVYDLIHLRCAQKADCDRLYTFNVKDFRALAPEDFRERVCAP